MWIISPHYAFPPSGYIYIFLPTPNHPFPNTLPKRIEQSRSLTPMHLFAFRISNHAFAHSLPPSFHPPSLTFSLHSPTQTTNPPLLLHKRPTLQAIPTQPPPRRFKRGSRLTPQTKLWWRLGQTRHRSAHVRGSETPVLRYGLWRLFQATGFAGEVVERVVQCALRTGPCIWRQAYTRGLGGLGRGWLEVEGRVRGRWGVRRGACRGRRMGWSRR
jgi:hypothetical protein